MKRGTLFGKLMLYLVSACVLTASLTAAIYFFFGIRAFAAEIVNEMMPRARSVARLSARYLEGKVGFDALSEFVLNDQRSGSHVYIYDDQGNLFAYSASADEMFDETKRPTEGKYARYVSRILTSGAPVSETNWRKVDGVLIGVPIVDNMERVTGAVLVTKPANQLRAAMFSLTLTLLMSSAGAAACLVVLGYFGSRTFVKPIRQMTQNAIAMAAGDFSARADEEAGGEIGQLGKALNFLSAELSETIEDLTLARNRLTTILTGLSEGVVALDHTFVQITFMNPAAQTLLRSDGKTLFSDESMAEQFENACHAMTRSETPVTLHFSIDNRQLLLTLTRSQAAVETLPGAIVLVQDVTEAERLEQTRREYVANVSHELKTPIASIRSLAEALNDGLIHTEQDRARYYGHILRESMRLSRLINDLLELSRLQSGAVALTKQPFPLDALLAETAERMRINADYSDITLRYTPAALPTAYSNRDRIEQVLVALVDNAIKYASDGGVVTLTAEEDRETGKLRVEVHNSGHIDEKDLPHLFERFYKADRSHAEQGTGLGLAIAKEILQLLGEEITASNRDGEAVFSFTVSKY